MSDWPEYEEFQRWHSARLRRIVFTIFVLLVGLVALLLLLVSVAHAQSKSRPLAHPPYGVAKKAVYIRCTDATAIDGDTVKCKEGYKLRLLGIQAPEIRCKPGLECIAGDAAAAQATLRLGMQQGPLTWRYIRRDKYGRPVVIARAGDINLSCWQIATSDTVYRADMDHRKRVARACAVSEKKKGAS